MRQKSNSFFFFSLKEEKCLGVRSFKEEVKILRGELSKCATKPEQTAERFQTGNVPYSTCNMKRAITRANAE